MSVPKLIELFNNCIKENLLSRDDYNFILRKASEWNVNPSIINELIKAKNITLKNADSEPKKEDLLNSLNKDIQIKFSEWYKSEIFSELISFFEEKLSGTLDQILIQFYLKSLLRQLEYKKANAYIKSLLERDLKANSDLLKTILQVHIRNENFEKAFLICYDLLKKGDDEMNSEIEFIAKKILEKRDFNLLHLCEKLPNHIQLSRNAALKYYEENDFKSFITLFKRYFKEDLNLAKQYIWSLYKTEGELQNAYNEAIFYYNKIANPSSLDYYLGLICGSLKNYKGAYHYLSKCLSGSSNAQEYIDYYVKVIIHNKEWLNLDYLKDSINYQEILNEKIKENYQNTALNSVIEIFEKLNSSHPQTNKENILLYTIALKKIDQKKALSQYRNWTSFFSDNDLDWISLGADLFEMNDELDIALEKYTLANKLSGGGYSNDIKRITFILHPEALLEDLYKQDKFDDVVSFFETKSSQLNDIKSIEFYIRSLFKKNETENKALEKGIFYANNHPEGARLYILVFNISKILQQYSTAKEYILKAKIEGLDVEKDLRELNAIISREEEIEKKRKEETQNKQTEEKKQKSLQDQALKNKKETEEVSIKQDSSITHSNQAEDFELQNNSTIEENYHFKSSITCGGDPVLPEHIYIDKNEVRYEKKSGIFSKESKSIQLKDITQVDLNTSMVCGSITIRSSASGSIHGEHFSKSNVKEIKKLIESLK